jgi:L,D-transpeptidase ErfK/SrfK
MPHLIGLIFAAAISLFAVKPAAGEMIGETRVYTIQADDVFVDIARKFDLGYNALRAANPGVDAWIPPVGQEITLPLAHILPDAPRHGIVINLAEQRLYYFAPGGEIRVFPVGVVRDGLTMPHGPGRIIAKRQHPTWIPPASVRKERPELPVSVPPGPDNPLGDYALYTSWTEIRIHGTNKPMGVGRRVSHGCIRLYPEDIKWLFEHSEIGTPVTVVDQPVKTSWQGEKLYLEVHPRMEDADEVEANGRTPALADNGNFLRLVRAEVIKVTENRTPPINWALVEILANTRDGLPHQVTEE